MSFRLALVPFFAHRSQRWGRSSRNAACAMSLCDDWGTSRFHCCSVTKLCLTLCDPTDSSMPASLSLTISRSLPKFMSIALVMPSSHFILWRPVLLLPSIFLSIKYFYSEAAVGIRCQNTDVLAWASVLPMSIQGWFPLRLAPKIRKPKPFRAGCT